MPSFWKQTREYIVLILFLSVFVTLFYFGIVHFTRENQEKMDAIQQVMVDRKIFAEQLEKIPIMRSEVEMIQSKHEQTHLFFSPERVVALVEKVEEIGQNLGVEVVSEESPVKSLAPVKKKVPTSTTEDGTKKDSKKSTVPVKKKEEKPLPPMLVSLLPAEQSAFITFRVRGSYSNVIAFSNKLDTMPAMMDVLSLEMSQMSDDTDDEIQTQVTSARNIASNDSPFVVEVQSDIPAQAVFSAKEVTALFHVVLYLEL